MAERPFVFTEITVEFPPIPGCEEGKVYASQATWDIAREGAAGHVRAFLDEFLAGLDRLMTGSDAERSA